MSTLKSLVENWTSLF